MIQNKHLLDDFYYRLNAREDLTYREAAAIFDMLHKEAVSVGAIGPDNMLEGIEVDIKIASAVNRAGQ
ncbi:hypothetical protein ACQ9LF_01040 [Anaerohalosphaeraceae bacterium U12dextr]|jgi:hypothetical protein